MVEISIIIPCYNTPDELLTRCADSIRRQDFSDFEVIFVFLTEQCIAEEDTEQERVTGGREKNE